MSEHVLADGTHVRIRPLTKGDAPALREAWERLSAASRQHRFFGPVPRLTDEMVRYLTDVDGHDHIALAAIVDSVDLKTERGVGVARCIRLDDEPEVAEAAVTVIDEMQGQGVGRLLATALAAAASRAGIKRFRGELLEENAKVRALLSDLGIAPKRDDQGIMVFDVDISRAASFGEELGSVRAVRDWMRAAATTLGEAVASISRKSPGDHRGPRGDS